MTRNHQELLKAIKNTTEKLISEGYSTAEAKELVYLIITPLKSEIDQDNVFKALVELNSL